MSGKYYGFSIPELLQSKNVTTDARGCIVAIDPSRPFSIQGSAVVVDETYDGPRDNAELLGIWLPPAPPEVKYELRSNKLWVPKGYSAYEAVVWPTSTFTLRYSVGPWTGIVGDAGQPTTGCHCPRTCKVHPIDVVCRKQDSYITAYRAWEYIAYGKDGGALKSVSHSWVWPHGVPMEAGVFPARDNTAGIYAYPNKERLSHYWDEESIEGEVALWGKVFKHADGVMRAQYAYPLKLHVREETTVDAKLVAARLARSYGVPVDIIQYDGEDD